MSADQWNARYETVRRRALCGRHAEGGGWELALFVRRGAVAWMRGWSAVTAAQAPCSLDDSCAKNSWQDEIPIPSTLCKQITTVLVNMILPQRTARQESVF
jgi:hypothetical protein